MANRPMVPRPNTHTVSLPFPEIVDSFHIKDTLYHERSMQDVLSYASEANICIITMGKFDTQCAMARVGYLSESEVKQLTTHGVVVNFSQGMFTSAPLLMMSSTCINSGKSSMDTIPLSANLRTALAVRVAITIDSNVTPANSSIA